MNRTACLLGFIPVVGASALAYTAAGITGTTALHGSPFAGVAVTKVFDESSRAGGDAFASAQVNQSCMQTAGPTQRCALFDPFSETPVEGVHQVKRRIFGQATSTAHFQTARTNSSPAGVRF